jgi:hypothetical protein
MDDRDRALAHSLKIRFGTAPAEPDEGQLRRIKKDIWRIIDAGRSPTDKDWSDAVTRHCTDTGHYAYKGLDNSDLLALLKLASKPTQS